MLICKRQHRTFPTMLASVSHTRVCSMQNWRAHFFIEYFAQCIYNESFKLSSVTCALEMVFLSGVGAHGQRARLQCFYKNVHNTYDSCKQTRIHNTYNSHLRFDLQIQRTYKYMYGKLFLFFFWWNRCVGSKSKPNRWRRFRCWISGAK